MDKQQQVFVLDGTKVTTLYEDDLVALDLGKLLIKRASHIEPSGSPYKNNRGYWKVKLTDHKLNGKYKGKVLGTFNTHKEALEAEKEFLLEKVLN
jgi:hypothetical protein